MIDPSVEQQLIEQLNHLPADRQQQVLEFARKLAVTRPIGLPGQVYLAFSSGIEPQDLETMARTIEEDCEQVRVGEW